tara:strand:- start:138 stop:296 length:159 start_codon:yes stop_codon:yes gene_type:complete
MAFKMTEEEYEKTLKKKAKASSKKTPVPKKKKRYNPFKDGRTPTGASYTTGP